MAAWISRCFIPPGLTNWSLSKRMSPSPLQEAPVAPLMKAPIPPSTQRFVPMSNFTPIRTGKKMCRALIVSQQFPGSDKCLPI
jgi:hypothetical protein